MPAPTTETWSARDLPFLVQLVKQLDEHPQTAITGADVAIALSLDDTDALRALANLKRGGHVIERNDMVHRVGAGPLRRALDVTDTALLATGTWPTPETALDRLVTALEAVATDDTATAETRSNAQRAASWLRSSVDTVGLGIATAVITGQLPGQ